MEEELDFARSFAHSYGIDANFYGIPFDHLPGHIIGEIRRLKQMLEDNGYPLTEENLFSLMKLNKLLYNKVLSTPKPEVEKKLRQTLFDVQPVAGIPPFPYILVAYIIPVILLILRETGVFQYSKELLAQKAAKEGRRTPERLQITVEEGDKPIRTITIEYWKDQFADKELIGSVQRILQQLKKKE